MEKPAIIHWNITVKGRVQGVGFRYTARSVANMLGIKGFVKNLPNRDVYIEAEGSLNQLNEFVNWCQEGPPHAKVEHVSYMAGSSCNYNNFEVRS